MNFIQARRNMVEQQVRPWDVLDLRVLEVLEEMPREQFVPAEYAGLAYADLEIPLAHGEVMLAPKVVGRMLQALAPRPEETALEIGTGSGFVTACLAQLCAHVETVEQHDDLRLQARARLESLGIRNVSLRTATVAPTWHPPHSRYNLICVNGSMSRYQAFLQPYLALGGRLLVITGDAPVMQAQLILRVAEDSFRTESLFETSTKPLLGFEQRPQFVF